ncbi:hypothetical protein LXL04_005498 [Taraxacum kok-saghyz]
MKLLLVVDDEDESETIDTIVDDIRMPIASIQMASRGEDPSQRLLLPPAKTRLASPKNQRKSAVGAASSDDCWILPAPPTLLPPTIAASSDAASSSSDFSSCLKPAASSDAASPSADFIALFLRFQFLLPLSFDFTAFSF